MIVVFSLTFFALCYFVLVFFSTFCVAITSLGAERANLSAFRTFVRFVLVWFCLFSLPLCVWEGLRPLIVTLSGFFSYLFWTCAPNEDLNQPAHPCNLIVVCMKKLYIIGYPKCPTLRKHAYLNILKILQPKPENFQIKKFRYFSYFCSKHRLWVLVRTASPRRF